MMFYEEEVWIFMSVLTLSDSGEYVFHVLSFMEHTLKPNARGFQVQKSVAQVKLTRLPLYNLHALTKFYFYMSELTTRG